MTEEQEDRAYELQRAWIREHCGEKAADSANYGWFVDEVAMCIGTKVYGHGVLTTYVSDMEHEFEEWT